MFCFEIRVQRNEFLFRCANILLKKAFSLAQTTRKCAKKWGFYKKSSQ